MWTKAIVTGVLSTLIGVGDARSSPSGDAAVLEDGFYVKIYSDGSASVALGPDARDRYWSIDCDVDAMTDERECSFSNGLSGIFVYFGTLPAPEAVCILGHDFPRRTGQIRVGTNPPVTTDEEGCVEAAAILPQLIAGHQVRTRMYRWPHDYPQDDTHSLDGFNKAMEVVERIRNGSD